MARRVQIGALRREQIVDAAMGVIAEEGIQNLSLSAIEARARMSRGQLTYYFRTKEDILLAVFDRLLAMMHERARTDGDGPCRLQGVGWERMRQFLTLFLLDPPPAELFHALQYTFLAQVGHRDDFRRRLADLYEEWRGHMAADVAEELARPRRRAASPRTFATLVQAILHGLAMQRVADPEAFDRTEVLALCLEMLESYLRPADGPDRPSRNGHAPTNRARRARTPKRKP